jgi:hemoglobin
VSRPRLKALYQKIGGETRLKEILADFYRRMSQDVLIGFFFTDKNLDEIISRQQQFLMYTMGAIPSYPGKSPTLAHLELPPILAGHFDRRLVILEQTLKGAGLSLKDIRTWINLEKSFRPAIVSD